MKSLELINNSLRIELKLWEAIFWLGDMSYIPLNNIINVSLQYNMPRIFISKRRPIVNLPGIISIGEFYPSTTFSSKKMRKKPELWCINFRHKSFLTLFIANESHKKIVLGMSKEEGEEWYSKILNLITNNDGNNTDN